MSVKKKCEVCGFEKKMDKNRTKCNGCRKFEADVKAGRIKGPDYKAVNTRNYKDPMRKVEDGFGYYGAITESNDGELIQCHICGYYFGNVGAHVQRKHKIAPRSYKIKYGLRVNEGLLSPVFRKAAQENYNKYARKTPEEYREMSRKGRGKARPSAKDWTAQTRNETGTCKDQTLAKIRELASRMDGSPTWHAYVQDYGGMDVVKHWFGSWKNAVREAGFDDFYLAKSKERPALVEEGLGQIRDFYRKNGRTPQWSDFRSANCRLPKVDLIQRAFGSLNNARAEAGAPQLVKAGPGLWKERM